jgi:hypothetical protein
MEPKMTRLKLLSTAALVALALPLAISSEVFAQQYGGKGGYARGGGGASFSGGGMRGGGVATAGPRFSGGGMSAGTRFSGGAGPSFGGRVGTTSPSFSGRVATSSPSFSGGGGNWQGGGYAGNYRYRHRGGGFWPGVAVGAAIGAGSYAYYGSPGYYNSGYYDDSYYYDDSVAVAPAPEGGDASYCAQTYQSYDPASGMYLGYDGQWHPCP